MLSRLFGFTGNSQSTDQPWKEVKTQRVLASSQAEPLPSTSLDALFPRHSQPEQTMEVEPSQAPYQPLVPKPIQWTPSKDTSERMERTDSPHARVQAGQDSLHGLGRQPRKGKQSFTPIKSNTPSRLQEEREQERLKERERLKDEREMKGERDEHSLKRKEPPAWHRKRRSLYCLPIKQICHANRKQLYVDTIYDDVRDVVHISTLSTNPNQELYAETILEQLSYYRDLIETLKIFFLPSGREALLACAKDENVQMEIRQECSALINTWDSLKKFKPKPSSFKAPAQAATILDDDEPGTDSVSLKDKKMRDLDEDDSVEPVLKKQKRDHVQSSESDDIVVETPTVATSSQSTTASSSTTTATTTSAIPVETQPVIRGSADVFKMPLATASIFREQQADKERADKEKVDKDRTVIDLEADKPVLVAEATPLTTPKKLQMVTDPTDTTFARPPKKDDALESKDDAPSSAGLRLFEAPEKKAESEDKETTESASTGLSISFGTLPSGPLSLSLPALPASTSPSKPSFSFGVGDTGLKIPSFGSLAGITATDTATTATSTASTTATSTDSTATTTATTNTTTTPAPTGLFKDIFFGAPEKKDTPDKKEGGLTTLGQSSPVFNFRASTATTTSATTASTTAPLSTISFDKATTTATTSTSSTNTTTTAAFVFGATSPAKEGTSLFPTAPTTTTSAPTTASTPAFSGFNVEASKPGPSSSFTSLLFDGASSSKSSKEKSKPSLSQTGSGPLAGFTFGSNNAAPTTTASTQAPAQTGGSVFSFGATQQSATAPPTATPSVFPSFGASSSSTSTSNMFGGGSGMNEESTSTFPKFGNNSDSMDMGSPSPFVPNSQSSGAIFTSFNSNAASTFGSAPSFGSSTASPFGQSNNNSAPVFPFGDANKPALSASHFGTTQNVFGSNTNNNSNSGSMFGQQQNKPLFANPSTASITPSMFSASPAPSNNNSGGMFSSSSAAGGSSFQGFGSSGEADMFGLGGAKSNATGGRKKVVAKRNTKGK